MWLSPPSCLIEVNISLSLTFVNTLPTLSDTKRAFYAAHTRPLNSIYRRVVEELMVEMHLLGVNATFTYDAVYALGVVTSFDRFMDGYRPSEDVDSIFGALCQAVGREASQYRRDAEQAIAVAQALSGEDLIQLFTLEGVPAASGELGSLVARLSDSPTFKYSRLFAIGLFTLLDTAAPEMVKESEPRNAILDRISAALHLPQEKLKKDIELYQSNLEKMGQAKLLMEEMTQVERKKREQRAQEKAAKAAAKATENPTDSPETIAPGEETPGDSPAGDA